MVLSTAGQPILPKSCGAAVGADYLPCGQAQESFWNEIERARRRLSPEIKHSNNAWFLRMAD